MSDLRITHNEDTGYERGYISGYLADGSWIRTTVERVGALDPDRREHWYWRVTRIAADDSALVVEAGEDDLIRSGAHGIGGGVEGTLRALASFLGAYAESSEDSENAYLFPPALDRSTAEDAADLISWTLGSDDE
jgi:hypothetical protein